MTPLFPHRDPTSTPRRGVRPRSGSAWHPGLALLLLLLVAGCSPEPRFAPPPALVVTQVPDGTAARSFDADLLDLRYPHGTRIVLLLHPAAPDPRPVVVSRGLGAAGDPALGPDGHQLLFVARRTPSEPWQIHWVDLRGGTPRAVTDLPGGAMSPAWLPGGRFAFVSPVPRAESLPHQPVPALYSRDLAGGAPLRLTHGSEPVTDLTLLRDGRLLLVGGLPSSRSGSGQANPSSGLFTLEGDRAGMTPVTALHDHPSALRRPRECPNGRIVFLASGAGAPLVDGRAEQIILDRPVAGRTVVFPQFAGVCRSIEPMEDGGFLATLRDLSSLPETRSFGVYRLGSAWTPETRPLFDDPAWHEVEAISVRRARLPVARIPSVSLGTLGTLPTLGISPRVSLRHSPQTAGRRPPLTENPSTSRLWNSNSTPGPNPP